MHHSVGTLKKWARAMKEHADLLAIVKLAIASRKLAMFRRRSPKTRWQQVKGPLTAMLSTLWEM